MQLNSIIRLSQGSAIVRRFARQNYDLGVYFVSNAAHDAQEISDNVANERDRKHQIIILLFP